MQSLVSIPYVIVSVCINEQKLYLLIDEYDSLMNNFFLKTSNDLSKNLKYEESN